MRVLLDTHAILWWAMGGGARLSDRSRGVIEDAQTEVLVSAASAAEIAIKAGRGRLELPDAPERYVVRLIRRNGFTILPVQLAHALRSGALPPIHRDPWDRILIAQSQLEDLPIITADPAIGRYDVDTIW